MRLLILSGLVLVCSSSSAAPTDLSVSLPLGPYYRPGRYVPVRFQGAFPDEGNYRVAVTAANVKTRDDISRGAGRTSINLRQGRFDATVPWLVMERYARHPKLVIEDRPESADGPPLQELRENHRLVGHTTPVDPAFARRLASTSAGGELQITPIALDPAHPIRGHACAYEVLDAIVLDESSAARLRPDDIPNLLACGVTVAIKTTRPPLPEWPWKRVGDFAVLRHDVVGPDTAGYHEAAYAPVADWQAGSPWAFRRRVLLVAGLCCVLILALALWRPRGSALWAALLIAGMLTAIGRWSSGRTGIQRAGGEIVVMPAPGVTGLLTQTDAWTFQTASAARFVTLKWSDVARPVFAGDAGVNDVWISLNCDPDGRPTEFGVRIPKDRKIAFCSRSVGSASPQTVPQSPVSSRLKPLAESLYARPAVELKGELLTSPPSQAAHGLEEIQQWNAAILHRQ